MSLWSYIMEKHTWGLKSVERSVSPCFLFHPRYFEIFVVAWLFFVFVFLCGCVFDLFVFLFGLPAWKFSRCFAYLLAGSLFNKVRVEVTDDAQNLIGNCIKKIWSVQAHVPSDQLTPWLPAWQNHPPPSVPITVVVSLAFTTIQILMLTRDDFLPMSFFFLGGVFCIVFVFVCFPPNDRHPVGSPSSLFYAACGTSNQVSCVSDSTE